MRAWRISCRACGLDDDRKVPRAAMSSAGLGMILSDCCGECRQRTRGAGNEFGRRDPGRLAHVIDGGNLGAPCTP